LSETEAELRLRTAVGAHIRADTAIFTQQMVVDGGPQGRLTTTQQGEYRISTRAATATTTMTGSGQLAQGLGASSGAAVVVRVVGDATYLNSPAWPAEMRRCWMNWTTDQLASQAGGVAPAAGESVPTANLAVLETAKANGGEQEFLTGSVAAAEAAQLFGSGVMKMLRKPLTSRLPATFRIAPAGVEFVTINGKPLAGALEASGQGLSKDELDLVAAMKVTVRYEAWKTPVTVRAPAKSLLLAKGQESC